MFYLCIQESWLSEGDDISQIQIEGYDCTLQGKLCSSEEGLLIYLHTIHIKGGGTQVWEC